VDDETETSYDLTLARWLNCRDHPEVSAGVCLEEWEGDAVFTDPDLPTLRRTLPFDEDLTVVIMPIPSVYEPAIVGNGIAFRDLLSDLHTAVAEEWHFGGYFVEYPSPELRALTSDPEFPFGIGPALYPNDPGTGGYRGPGGSLLTWYFWHVLEIRNGRPVLYVDAGLIAG
jgi:hypothetical protein